MGTRTAECAPGVVVGVLVKRNLEGRVGVAEDVSTSAAVVSSRPGVEVAHTRRFVADGGLSISLFGCLVSNRSHEAGYGKGCK